MRKWGQEGLLTQITMGSGSERIRSLAISLDLVTRATTSYSLGWNVTALRALEEIVFVAKHVDEGKLLGSGWRAWKEIYRMKIGTGHTAIQDHGVMTSREEY
ncbi:hypothetical protein CJF31_00008185 [Rutstroemia sp. NJR-2017a BVV2]|nr:hypothetical protein CJF31_00008185 [Rutstroemia sp. NJR-2017a BVV2]